MLLDMRDICKDYPLGKETVHILKNVDLQVAEGDFAGALIGRNGQKAVVVRKGKAR